MTHNSGLPVPTASLSGLAYDPVRRVLAAGLGNGPKRYYLEVPPEVYGMLSRVPAPGVYFRQFVDSGRYPWRVDLSDGTTNRMETGSASAPEAVPERSGV